MINILICPDIVDSVELLTRFFRIMYLFRILYTSKMETSRVLEETVTSGRQQICSSQNLPGKRFINMKSIP